MTHTTHHLACDGDTYPVRGTLKDRGWKYDGQRRRWYKTLTEGEASQVRTRDAAVLRSHGMLRGCRLLLDGIEVWRSKSYVAPAVHRGTASSRDPDGLGWNVDAAGNHVASRPIPGSDPNDRI